MRVQIGDLLEADVEVSSDQIKPYVLECETKGFRGTLSISFINDGYRPPEDRNLWIDRAEIRYKALYWE